MTQEGRLSLLRRILRKANRARALVRRGDVDLRCALERLAQGFSRVQVDGTSIVHARATYAAGDLAAVEAEVDALATMIAGEIDVAEVMLS